MNSLFITLFFICLVGIVKAQHTKASFQALKTSQTGYMELNGSIEEVFPLFDPINEQKWIPEWSIQTIYERTPGKIEAGMVFRTDEGKDERLWTILEFDETNRKIQYLYFWPENDLVIIDLRFDEWEAKKVKVEMTYTLTALSEAGNQKIKKLAAEGMEDKMVKWEKSINQYLSSL